MLADALPAYVSAEVPTAPAAARAAPASLACCGAGCLLEQLRHICAVDAPLAALCDGTALGAAHRREVATLIGAAAGAGASSSSSGGGGGGSSDSLSAREEASVREMREIFADCGVGFLGALLRHCGGSAEAAVDLLFSERPLPAALAHVPRDTPTFPPPPPAAKPAPAPAPAPAAASVDPTTAAAMAAAAKRSAKKGPAASAVRAEDASETRQALGDHAGGGGRRLLPKALAQALGEAGADEYEDEWDDSLEQLAAVGGGGMLQESADDLEEAAARRAGGRPDGGAAAGPAQRPAAADAASLPRRRWNGWRRSASVNTLTRCAPPASLGCRSPPASPPPTAIAPASKGRISSGCSPRRRASPSGSSGRGRRCPPTPTTTRRGTRAPL